MLMTEEYTLDKQAFTLIHANQRKDSTGRKRRIEYPCDTCGDLYVTKLRDEMAKDAPWLCRSCRTRASWKLNTYRERIMSGITDGLRELRRKQCSATSLKMWADPDKRNEISMKLRARDASVYSTARRVMRRSVMRKHWLTHVELVCVGSYEVAFVDWCNTKQIDFDWQIPHRMPDGRLYIIDAFIKGGVYANTWVEIKGYMTTIGRQKWEWFHAEHSNDSQLWMQVRLREIGVLI